MRRTTQGRQKIVWLFCRKRRLFRHKHYSGVAIYITKDTIALNRLRKGDSGSYPQGGTMSQWVARIGDVLYHTVRMDNGSDNAPWQHGWGNVMSQVGNAPAPIAQIGCGADTAGNLQIVICTGIGKLFHTLRHADLAEFLGRCICALRDPSAGDHRYGLRAGNR